MLNKNDKDFIGVSILDCIKKGIKVVFVPQASVSADGDKCNGFFAESDKELYVATRTSQKNWFPIFIHEFCHFRQWIEKDPVFMKLSNHSRMDDDMWSWLQGKDIPTDRVKKSVRAYQEMELDCEKRVVKLIDKYNLSIEKYQYIKSANIYVLFYGVLLKTRKWYAKSPYTIKALYNYVPDTFIKSFTLPKKFEEIVMKKCF